MYLRNVWYVAAEAADVTRDLRRIRVLGEDICIYRTERGDPVALEDACPHRKLPLSMGRVKGDMVECGYHGLTFDRSGACQRVPGQSRIPPGARVHAYPTLERYGLVWIWMGDPALADPGRVMAAPNYGAPGWAVSRGKPLDIACNYQLINDNLLDPSHVAWVHVTSFGNAACEDTPLQVEVNETGVTVSRWMFEQEVAPFYRSLVPFEGRCDRLQHYEVRFPSHAYIVALFTPAGEGGRGRPLSQRAFMMESFNLMTPVDEGHTRYYYFQLRNVRIDDAAVSHMMAEGVRAAFMEDSIVLSACQSGLANPRTPPIDLAIDAGPLRFRRQLDKHIAEERRSLAAE
jgi:phenylpropionate dioxygenase-like ring-hydroxylating dioxygenase large terminal subunit